MDSFKKGWFNETSPMWAGLSQSLEVERVLHTERSKYQDISVLQTKAAGRVLVLDGVIQATELDEFAYQEMLAHVPLYAHPRPERVLVVGGGDGGIVREVCRHPSVRHVDLCDIDERVTAVSREWMPAMTAALDDPRVHVRFEDGAAFVRRATAEYDVIITDSSDPVGPAETLYRAEYYAAMRNALRPGGIVAAQGESMWLHAHVIRGLFDSCRAAGFASVEYAIIQVPTYPGGSIGALVASEGGSCAAPRRLPTPAEQAALRYYTPAVHAAAFALPPFLTRALADTATAATVAGQQQK